MLEVPQGSHGIGTLVEILMYKFWFTSTVTAFSILRLKLLNLGGGNPLGDAP